MYYWDVIRVLLKVHVIVFSICIVIFTECEKMASSKKGKKKRQKSKLPAAPFKLSSEDLMTLNLSGIRSEALIGRRSSYMVLAIVYK